jgi:hypothetical protein
MANLTDGIRLGAISSCDFTNAGRIVDVGGGDGAVLAHILAAVPGTTGIVFDLPHVVAEAGPRLAGYGLGDRLTLAAGDFFTAVPEGADTYLLSMILHDWSDPEAHRLLAAIRAAAPAGAQLLAFELVTPDGAEPHMAKMIDLTMLGMLTGRERTQAEYRLMLEQAGFKFEGVTATPNADLDHQGPRLTATPARPRTPKQDRSSFERTQIPGTALVMRFGAPKCGRYAPGTHIGSEYSQAYRVGVLCTGCLVATRAGSFTVRHSHCPAWSGVTDLPTGGPSPSSSGSGTGSWPKGRWRGHHWP